MIGQRDLLKKIEGQIGRSKFPRVSILIGEKGSGRKTLARKIARKLDYEIRLILPTEDFADVVINSLKDCPEKPTVYVYSDIDFLPIKMMDILRVAVENVLPETYIIITCEMLDNIPLKIKNNAVTYVMEPYSYEDKCDYLDDMSSSNHEFLWEDEEQFILDVASNIGDCRKLLDFKKGDSYFKINIRDFKTFVEDTLKNVLKNTDISSEIGDRIALHNEDDKIPMQLFWKAFMAICGDKMQTENDSVLYCRLIAITGENLQQLSVEPNQESVFNTWITQIKSEISSFYS